VKRLFQILRKHRVGVALGAVFLALGGFMVWGVFAPRTDRRLEAIRKSGYPVTEADLEAWYPSVPDAENAALIYAQAFAQPGFSNLAPLEAWYERYSAKGWLPPRGQVLSEETKGEMQELLATNATTLDLLYSARTRPRSRYPVQWNQGLDMSLPHLLQVKGAVTLLRADALLHCAEGKPEEAVQALLAAGHAADSLSAEPLLTSHLTRIVCWGMVVASMERVMNALPLTEDQLAALQKMVSAVEKPQAFARTLAGERVLGLALFSEPNARTRLFSGRRFEAGVFFSLRQAAGIQERDRAFYLDVMATNLSIAEMSWPSRVQLGRQQAALYPAPINRFFMLSAITLPGLEGSYLRDADHAARMRAAQATLAVQRFRRAHNNALPPSLRELEPTWLNPVPADPYDGQPLRFRNRGSGFVIYSIGRDGHDDEGTERDSTKPNTAPFDIPFIVDQ
jgi:hypothetical protein